MTKVLFTKGNETYLERLCYDRECAERLAKELNEKNNTNIYFAEDVENEREKDFYDALIG